MGIEEKDFGYVFEIFGLESSWRFDAVNPESGAFGVCQALPANKMASAGSDWKTNPLTQIKWCKDYAENRYGSWAAAYEFWLNNHWW